MECGIIGPPAAGKSALFSALTGVPLPEAGHSRRETQRGVAKLTDPRLVSLAQIAHSAKIAPAAIEYVDVPGAVVSSDKREPYPTAILTELRTTSLLVLVLRDFPLRGANPTAPAQDLAAVELEFIVNDLAVTEKRLERLAKQHDPLYRQEAELLERCRQTLNAEIPLRRLQFDVEVEKILRGFSFLSVKPLLIVLNISEDEITNADTRLANLRNSYTQDQTAMAWTAVSAEIEAEIAQLDEVEREPFRRDLGLGNPASERIMRAAFDLLGLITFFTANEKDAAARLIKAGSNALAAAYAVHNDIGRGFIRAEVCHSADLIRAGSLHKLKEEGKLRLEGRDYIVQDGDVIYIRFNV